MHISWLGQTCVKIQTKNNGDDTLVLIDAYKPTHGDFPRSFTPDIALFSSGNKNTATLSQNPFIVDTLGEFELKNIVIYSIINTPNNHIFKISTEGMTIVHLGRLNKKPENGELEQIMNPDILLIPVGGNKIYLDIKDVTDLVTTLEPRIVVPIGYNCDTEPEAKSISSFIAEIGIKPEEKTKKIIIKKKDLPAEETKLFILEKE